MAKVLVVDDSLSVRKVVERALAGRRIEAVTVASGLEALERIEREAPDVVVCDVVMPGRPASELAAALRAADPALCVLWTSAHAPQRVLSPGEPFLPKPFTSLDLLRAVRAALDQRVAASRPT